MKNKTLTIAPVALVAITFLIGLVLSSTLTHADGNTDVVDELDITVNSSCTMKGGPNGTDDSGSSTYTTTINAGNYTELSGSKLVTLCNDPAGYAIYAIGFSGDSYDSETHTNLIGTASTGNIQTGTSGNNSYWAMKLEAVEGLTPPSIVTDFQNYHVIPDTYTKVASYTTPTATASDAGATVQTKYKINISRTQLAGAYNGKVKYTMVHPSTAPAPTPPTPPAPGLCTDTATCMQTMTTCPTTPTTVTDGRDGKTYNVQQLNDGNCWMLENLRLNLVDSTVQGNLTSDTTNAEDSSLAYLKGTATYRNPSTDPNGKYPTAGLNSTPWTSRSQNFYSVPMIMSSGTCYDASYCVNSPTSGQWNSEVVTPQTINGVTSIAQGKVGIYYNYCAISAGTYCYGNGTSSTGTPSSDPKSSSLYDIDGDICPKGWRLPTSTAEGEFQALYTAYNSDYTAFQTALDTPLSGSFYSGTAGNQGNNGYFWSSTWHNTSYMRYLGVNSSNVNPSYLGSRYIGYSARCILDS